ncbi:MAG TPA: hypothetical protein DIT09_09745 [Glutamicibacter sp.]|nr:hypothetical protein [Glutamicibacter sp.]
MKTKHQVMNLLRFSITKCGTKQVWDHGELTAVSMDGELIARYDFPFPDAVTSLGLRHEKEKFQIANDAG